MENYTFIFIAIGIFVLALAIGFYVGQYVNSQLQQNKQKIADERISQMQKDFEDLKLSTKTRIVEAINEREDIREKKEDLQNQLTKLRSEYDHLTSKHQEQRQLTEDLNKKFHIEFENLASKILEQKSVKFTEQNKTNLNTILIPLQEKIKHFEEKVEKTHKESIGYHFALREQIKGLTSLNEQMSKEAVNLTKALKGDSKIQGNWGELVLERVLEKSGLEKDREYFVQHSFTTNEGKRVIPDVVIHLPGNKKMIIDAKVSLTAYERYINSEGAEKLEALKKHIESLKSHIDQLSSKNYQDIYQMESPDFVLLFVPVEPAFAVAVNEDNTLYNNAFEKNIVIVTPTTLLATLRTIDTMWNTEKQQQNALEIATQAGRLYDQFVNLTDELIKLGNQLKTVQNSYDGTMKKLTGRGNLITKVENIKKLGIKQKKNINDKLVQRATRSDIQQSNTSGKL